MTYLSAFMSRKTGGAVAAETLDSSKAPRGRRRFVFRFAVVVVVVFDRPSAKKKSRRVTDDEVGSSSLALGGRAVESNDRYTPIPRLFLAAAGAQ